MWPTISPSWTTSWPSWAMPGTAKSRSAKRTCFWPLPPSPLPTDIKTLKLTGKEDQFFYQYFSTIFRPQLATQRPTRFADAFTQPIQPSLTTRSGSSTLSSRKQGKLDDIKTVSIVHLSAKNFGLVLLGIQTELILLAYLSWIFSLQIDQPELK